MLFEDTTVQITVSKERLLYCFKADTIEEFDRRMKQLANDMQLKIESELHKKLYERGEKQMTFITGFISGIVFIALIATIACGLNNDD